MAAAGLLLSGGPAEAQPDQKALPDEKTGSVIFFHIDGAGIAHWQRFCQRSQYASATR